MRGRPRLPLEKARVTGAIAANPKRFDGRKEPATIRIGGPSKHLDEQACKAWRMFVREIPWLMESDRGLLEAASIARGALIAGQMSVPLLRELRTLCSLLGATPVDRSKIKWAADEAATPEDAYFN